MTESGPAPWVAALQGAVPKSALDRHPPGRMVDVVCSADRCGERLAMVADSPEGPWLTVWTPTVAFRVEKSGEPYWSVMAGPAPAEGPPVTVHCFRHGHGSVPPARLTAAVAAYRRGGRTQRVLAA